jgi:hypothetical protein
MEMEIKIPGDGIARVAQSDFRGEIYTLADTGWRGELFLAGITRLAVRKNKRRLSPFQHTIDFDTTETGAKYVFSDATGDSYTVRSVLQGRQHVDYMSDRPNIVSVTVTLREGFSDFFSRSVTLTDASLFIDALPLFIDAWRQVEYVLTREDMPMGALLNPFPCVAFVCPAAKLHSNICRRCRPAL